VYNIQETFSFFDISNAQALFSGDLFSSSPSFLFIALILVCLLLYGLSLGRTRALVSLLAIYIAFVFELTFPYFNLLENLSSPLTDDPALPRAIVFFIVYGLVFMILNRSLIKQRLSLDEASIVSVVAISLLQLGFLASILSTIAKESFIIQIPFSIEPYISSPQALFYWSIIPIFLLLFMKRSRRSRRA